jgi:phosphodiesterase/alkaline phosphatase D-like protein
MRFNHRTGPSKKVLVLIGAAMPIVLTAAARAAASFNGVAAGDATSNDAILWTRETDSSVTGTALGAQVSTDPNFASNVLSFNGTTSPANDFTLKLDATGLTGGTQYYYRFKAPDGTLSGMGTFVTAPSPVAAAPLHFGFSGDVDGSYRPYSSMAGIASENYNFFVFLGDTMYETVSGAGTPNSSPATTSTSSNSAAPAQLLSDYHTKYLQQLQPVSTGPLNGLQNFFAAQGTYTLYDNHELGNRQYINGGAPAGGAIAGQPSGAGVDATNTAFDVNTTGTFINQSPGFLALQQAYLDYHPIRANLINSPSDPRSNGTVQLYYGQQWGKNAIFINADDRSYRDIRMKTASGADDTGPRADNPARTMLGTTQLAWLEQSLLNAQNSGTPWKFVAVSSPIDQIGVIGNQSAISVTNGGFTTGSDGGKSWMGEYRYERNQLLKFIADNHINNVVFLSTDDHQTRINDLDYSPTGQTATQSSYVKVPGNVFEIVDGPMGAGGPDGITDHSFANIKSIADSLASQQAANGIDPIGLDPTNPHYHMLFRQGDPTAATSTQPVDYYSPDTFNYASLDVSQDGSALTVTVDGIASYAANTFPQLSTTGSPQEILSFQVTAAPEPGTVSLLAAGILLVIAPRKRRCRE